MYTGSVRLSVCVCFGEEDVCVWEGGESACTCTFGLYIYVQVAEQYCDDVVTKRELPQTSYSLVCSSVNDIHCHFCRRYSSLFFLAHCVFLKLFVSVADVHVLWSCH